MDSPILYLILLLGCVVETGGVGCYQCNIYVQGRQNECGVKERKMHSCSGCVKTYVRGYMHDSWLRYRYTSVTTKYCIRMRQSAKPEGCYTTEGDAGYVRQCFCYTDWCNNAPVLRSHTFIVVSICIAIWGYFRTF